LDSRLNISFRPALEKMLEEPTTTDKRWFARLLEPQPTPPEPYAITVTLAGSHPRRHADRDLLRTAFRTAAAHGGQVQVTCSGEQSEHLAGHIEELRAELDAVGLGHIFEINCPGAIQKKQRPPENG
jgi:hypothetical protein